MADIYINSITPGHPCEGCKDVPRLKKLYGLRTYDRVPVVHNVRHGITHQEWPLNIIYTPLDPKGKSWMATNAFTGQRHQVVLHSEAPHRRTLEGDNLLQQFNNNKFVLRGQMVEVVPRPPPWLGVPSRDEFRCSCINCVQRIDPMRTVIRLTAGQTEKKPEKTSEADCAACQDSTVIGHTCGKSMLATLFNRAPKPYIDKQGNRAIGPEKLTRRIKLGEKPAVGPTWTVKKKPPPVMKDTTLDGEDEILTTSAVLSKKIKESKSKQFQPTVKPKKKKQAPKKTKSNAKKPTKKGKKK